MSEFINENKTTINLPIPLGSTFFVTHTRCGDFCRFQKKLFDKVVPPTVNGRCDANLFCHSIRCEPEERTLTLDNINWFLNNWNTRCFATYIEASEATDKIVAKHIDELKKHGFAVREDGYSVVNKKPDFDVDNINEMIGKVIVETGQIKIVSGYDYISKHYLLKTHFSNWIVNNYSKLTPDLMDKLKTPSEAIKDIEDKLSTYEDIMKIYKKFVSKCKPYEAENAIRRLYETRNNIFNLEKYYVNNPHSLYSSEDYKSFYEGEVRKHKKGERRILKIFYGKLDKNEYETLLNFISKHPSYNFSAIQNTIKKLNETKEDLKKLKEKYE